MGTVGNIFSDKKQKNTRFFLSGVIIIFNFRLKAVYNKAFAYNHSRKLCFGGVSGF